MENSGNFYNPNDPNIKCNAIWSNWGTTVTHQTINGKYRLSIKRADTKGIDGFTAEVCGDDLEEVETD